MCPRDELDVTGNPAIPLSTLRTPYNLPHHWDRRGHLITNQIFHLTNAAKLTLSGRSLY